MSFPGPSNEARRREALRRYGVDTVAADAMFDELAFLAATACSAPIAWVSFVDAQREMLRGVAGTELREAAREDSFCTHAILGDGVMEVFDTTLDERFAHSPLVIGEPHLRFYAGAPVRTADDLALGAVCVADVEPRRLGADEHRILLALARQVEKLLSVQLILGPDTTNAEAAIAERVLEQSRLEQSLSLLSGTFESIGDGVLVVDREGRIVTFNRRFVDLWKIPEEVLARRDDEKAIAVILQQLKNPDDFLARVHDLYESPEAVGLDSIEFRDGRVFERESRPQRIGDAIVGRLWSFRDITQRVRSERARDAAYAISQAAQDAHDLDDLFRSIHGAVRRLMPAENFYIALYDQTIDTISFPYFVDQFDPAPEPKRPGHGLTEYVMRTNRPLLASPEVFASLVSAGEVRTIGASSLDWLGVPLRDAGEAFGTVVVQSYEEGVRYADDDLELLVFVSTQIAMAIRRKQADAKLRDRETRLRVLMSQMPAIVWTTDADLRLTSAEGNVLADLGLAPAELVGRELRTILGDPENVSLAAHSQALHGEPVIYEGVFMKRSFVCQVEPRRDDDGRTIGVIGVGLDISDRKSLEQQLQHAQKMEAIGRLAGGIAHDFNNLLTSILGYCELALDRVPDGDPLRDDLREIEKAGERAAALTKQLLAFGRRQVSAPRLLDLEALVRDAGQMLRRLIGERIDLKIEADAGAGAVRADPDQLTQVLLNLAVNARDAMPEGGALRIAIERIDLAGPEIHRQFEIPTGSWVRLTVTDSGAGMTDDVLEHIFEPFFTTKELGKGTGLGLATVYGIVKQSGGYVTVESAPERGASFHVYLPRIELAPEPADAAAGTAGPVPVARARAATVLLVEDEKGVRTLARLALEKGGFKVLAAANAAEALSLEERHRDEIDLLLSDVIMPGLTGPELADELLRRRPRLRVLFVSGYPSDSPGAGSVLPPDAAFLQKPFTGTDLVRAVSEVIGLPG